MGKPTFDICNSKMRHVMAQLRALALHRVGVRSAVWTAAPMLDLQISQ
jgi:hypothetical protein